MESLWQRESERAEETDKETDRELDTSHQAAAERAQGDLFDSGDKDTVQKSYSCLSTHTIRLVPKTETSNQNSVYLFVLTSLMIRLVWYKTNIGSC